MTTRWTDSAQEHLNEYLARTRAALGNSGADETEVLDDLRRHIDEELAAARIRIVTEQDLKRVLTRLGTAETVDASAAADGAPINSQPRTNGTKSRPATRRSKTLLFFGVILPLLTIAIEAVTHMCAEVFFNPIPTVWHLLLVTSVPLINFMAWLKMTEHSWTKPVIVLNGFAIGVAAYYALLYLPLIFPAVIALIFFGWGLLPMAPMFSFVSALVLLRRIRAVSQFPLRGRWLAGLALSIIALALIVLPAPLTRHWAKQATSDSSAVRLRAVKLLRAFGDNKILLTDCYGSTAWSRGSDFNIGLVGHPLDPQRAREVYFRVTGKPFNTMPAPQRHFTSRGWDSMSDLTWDSEQGGEAVGGRIAGLSIAQSRMDGLLDADAGWVYLEWILEFKNVARVDREARAQIALPKGAAVSRLTLWVNGEEREAAFAGRSHVREAYRNVAVVQRRDPVLVTSCGPDRVLMQCFPVPRDGGAIKVRLGITAPMCLLSETEAIVHAPYFIERNFSIPDDFKHSLWIEAPQQLNTRDDSLRAGISNGRSGVRGETTEKVLQEGVIVRASRSSSAIRYWAQDYGSSEEAFIQQRIVRVTPAPLRRLVVALDSSISMREFYPEIAEALQRLPEGIEVSVVAASDGVVEVFGKAKTDQDALSQLARQVRKFQPQGGHDNLPALLRAWDEAADSVGGAVLWIHGPQPVLIEAAEALNQRLVWQNGGFAKCKSTIYSLQTTRGPDRILEKLDGCDLLHNVLRLGSVKSDLLALFDQWKGHRQQLEFTYDRVSSPPETVNAKESSRHLVRLWAFREICRLKSVGKVKEAVALAGIYQLVTPVSGAVVLETLAQFTQAGLTPVDAASVPVVPEPAGLFAIALAAVGGLLLLKRRRQAVKA